MNILYISKLDESKANGVTVSVISLLNSICNYSNVFWLDLGKANFKVNKKIKIISKKELNYSNYDIVVFEDPFNSFQFCTIAKKIYKNKIPYIIVPHGCFNQKALKRKKLKKKIAINTIFNSFFKNSNAIQFLTENEKNNSLSYNNSIIIPNGINATKYKCKSKCIKKIIYIGRKDIDHKGLDLLIYACDLIKKDLLQNNITIEIYGPNSNDNYIINDMIKKYSLEKIIINHGPLFGKEKEIRLSSADAFIQTSRYEGFPMSILEAFSYGLPVLITKGTNLASIVKENNAGFVCDTTVEDISKMIEEAIHFSDVCTICNNSKELSKKYSWDAISNKTVKEYSKIVKDYYER